MAEELDDKRCREECQWTKENDPNQPPTEPYCDPKTGEIVEPEPPRPDFPTSHLNTAKTNKYLLTFQTPEFLKDKIEAECFLIGLQSANIPSINIPATTISRNGGNIKVSSHGRQPFEPLTVTFKVDSKWKRYDFIYSWLNAFSEQECGFVKSPNSACHYSYADLIIFDECEEPCARWKYEMIFPVSLQEIQLDWTQDPNEIILQATFEYTFAFFERINNS